MLLKQPNILDDKKQANGKQLAHLEYIYGNGDKEVVCHDMAHPATAAVGFSKYGGGGGGKDL